MSQLILPELGGKAANTCFRAGRPLGEPAADVYSIDALRYHVQPDGNLRYERLDLMRMGGDDGRAYLADAEPKFNRMLADHGSERAERAAMTWGRLHGAEIQPWREIDEGTLLREDEPGVLQSPPLDMDPI